MRRQLRGYGIGLTAFYTSLVLEQPRMLGRLARRAPRALRDVTQRDSARNDSITREFPLAIIGSNVAGMLFGPLAYLRGRYKGGRRRAHTCGVLDAWSGGASMVGTSR